MQIVFHETNNVQKKALEDLFSKLKIPHKGAKGSKHHITVTKWVTPSQTVLKIWNVRRVTESEVESAAKKTWPGLTWYLYRVWYRGVMMDDYYVHFQEAPKVRVKQLSFEGIEVSGDDKWASRVTPEGDGTCSACRQQAHGGVICPRKREVARHIVGEAGLPKSSS